MIYDQDFWNFAETHWEDILFLFLGINNDFAKNEKGLSFLNNLLKMSLQKIQMNQLAIFYH